MSWGDAFWWAFAFVVFGTIGALAMGIFIGMAGEDFDINSDDEENLGI